MMIVAHEDHVLSAIHAKALHDKLEQEIIKKANASDVTALITKVNQTITGINLNEAQDHLIIQFANESTKEIPVATKGTDLSDYSWDFDANTNLLHLFDKNGNDVFEAIEINTGANLSDYHFEFNSDSGELSLVDTKGDIAIDPIWIGGGGGSGEQTYSVRMIDNMGSLNLTVASTQQTILNFKYIEYYGADIEYSSGLMSVQYKLQSESNWRNYITDQSISSNSNIQLNITNLLTEGNKTNIRIICSNGRSDTDLKTKTLTYNITSVLINISTTFNTAATYKGNLSIPYTCIGRGIEKIVYLYIDDVEYTHINIGTSNNQLLQLPVELTNYNYGSHIAKLFFKTPDNAFSNELVFPIMYDNGQSNKPIIGASFEKSNIEQGETLYLNYICYTPNQEFTNTLNIKVYSNENNQIEEYYNANFENITNNIIFQLPISQYPNLGTGYVDLVSDTTKITLSFSVSEIQTDYDINPITSGLVYSYRPTGYTNNTANKETYIYNLTDAVSNNRSIYSHLTGLNWITDGYLDGKSLTLAGSSRMTINLPILTTSFKNDNNQTIILDAASGATVTTSGRTIEFEFELTNVTNQNSIVFKCLDDNGVGFIITPQVCYLLSDGQNVDLDATGFIENEESIPCAYIKDEKHIRVSFVIEHKKYDSNKFISYANIFINGEYANSFLYPDDAIYDETDVITIGSNDCVTKIYDIKMYNRDLSKEEILKNMMNSDIDIRKRIALNEYNDILTDGGDVSYIKARLKYPCLLFIGNLSNYKNDKQYVGVILTKPDGLGSYTTEFQLLDQNAEEKFVSSIKVQGTSSQRFMRKNFKVYLVKNDGASTKKVKYVLKGYDKDNNPLSIGESTLCYKADYMSTDHANTFNANIADTLFNDKPKGSLIQNTVWGFRCLLFNMPQADYIVGTNFEDYPEGIIEFAGDGCLNNDKGNTKSFGLEAEGDEGNDTLQQKWEFKDNSNPLCTFKTDRLMERIYKEDNIEYTRQARNGLESCYPDEGDLDDAGIEPDYSHIQVLYTWLYQWANFWDASTTSGTGGTYNGNSYQTERELKKARFIREFTRHFNMEHALVYYIFIEWVALCDNRAKNMFLSCKNVREENIVFKDNSTSIWDCVNDITGEVNVNKINWENSTFCVWYCDLYDLDSCFGAENSGYMRIPYYADWNYILPRTGEYQFNGHDSRLWCQFEEAFADNIKTRAQQITRENTGYGTLNYGVLKTAHITNNAELVCPAVVNRDMIYKYEDPWTIGYWDYSKDSANPTWVQTSDYKYLQRGSRTEQKESFIYRRSMMLYSKYQCDQFKNDRLAFRCGAPVEKENTNITLSAIQAMWMGIQYGDSGNPVMSTKKAAGEYATIISPNSLGRSDNCYIMGASNLTSISSLAAFHPYEIGLTNAGKLKTLLIGSNEAGYTNGNLSALDTSSCALLDTLNIQNCSGFSDNPINLSSNTLIRQVYAGGSTVPYFTFSNGGILETLELGTPKRITLLNQSYMANFSYDSIDELLMLRVENTPNIPVLDILKNRLSSLRLGIRLININETITDNNYDIFKMLVSSAAKGKKLDANGNLSSNPEDYPTITGTINCTIIGRGTYNQMQELYPNLTINANQFIDQYSITFVNWDNSPILDIYGNAYVQYVDSGSTIQDPIELGEINIPTRASDSQYNYTFSSWSNISGGVITNRIVTAQYSTTVRKYTVEWYNGVDGTLLERQTNVDYGADVKPTNEHPTYTALEGSNIYYVHSGWDKSTGYIKGDTKVNATWIIGSLPEVGTKTLDQMSVAEISAIAKNNLASTYWQPKDYVDITLGRDYNFSNVESKTLISTPIYFDGTTAPIIFNGQNNRDLIQLFNADAPNFTLAVEYEFTSDTGVLVSCYDENGGGFHLSRRKNDVSNDVITTWGNKYQSMTATYNRAIATFRHIKGSDILYIGSDNNTSFRVMSTGSGTEGHKDHTFETGIQRSVYRQTDAPLSFGGLGNLDGTDDTLSRATGWIFWAKIWYEDLGHYNTHSIVKMPHYKIRMDYTNIKYRQYLGEDVTSDKLVNATFFADYPLPYTRRFASESIKSWDNSYTQLWLNNQFFDCLPLEWQSIIVTSQVKTQNVDFSGQVLTTNDKIFVPSWGDVSATTIAFYAAERDLQNHHIEWFVESGTLTGTNSRLAVGGVPIFDGTYNFIISSLDPTLDQNNTIISEKTIWIDTSTWSTGRIYVNFDTLEKIPYFYGAIDAGGQDAQQPDSEGNMGRWINSIGWWLRTPYKDPPEQYSSYQTSYIGNWGGHYYTNPYSGLYAVRPMFAI